MSQGQKYLPLDGGYGWFVVLGMALNNIITVPIMQGFGMIYGDTLKRTGISMTQSAVITNVNLAFGKILGIINGPLLRTFGYRKIAVFGAILYSIGIILTSFSSNMTHFVISYGMITSLGMNMNFSASLLAINTYFGKKKGRATGWAVTFTGLGPIFIPHLISYLLHIYGSEGTMFILGGLSLNSVIGSLLFQPIKWHAKPVNKPVNVQDETTVEDVIGVQKSAPLIGGSVEKTLHEVDCDSKRRSRKTSRKLSVTDYSDDNASVYGFEMSEPMINGSLRDLGEDVNTYNEDKKRQRKLSLNVEFEYKRTSSFNQARTRKYSLSSSKYSELGLSKKVLREFPEEDGGHSKLSGDEQPENAVSKSQEAVKIPILKAQEKEESNTPITKSTKSSGFLSLLLQRVSLLFDLDLLRDPIYMNIMLGLSIAIFAEFNFSVLTPFILADMNLNTGGIAVMMSILATSDLVLRALAPYIGEWLRKPPRVMYLVSLVLLVLARTALMFANSFAALVVVYFCLGVAKGVRTVYMSVVIPSYVPLEKLASANSIQLMVTGLLLLLAGPFLGLISDKTGSSIYSIIFLNVVTSTTVVMWLTEYLILYVMKSRKKNDIEMSEKEFTKIESR